jgi:Zn-dependent protease
MAKGFLTILRFRGIPVRAHWTLPLCALLAGRLQFVPALWLGFFLLVLIHELGHAAVVRHHGYEVLSIDVLGIGGLCRWEGEPTPIQRATIAWGGVWAQMLLWVIAQAALFFLGPPSSMFWAQLAAAFTTVNLWIMAVNLLPIPPLDGAEAWPLAILLWARRRAARGKVRAASRKLTAAPRMYVLKQAARREESALRGLDPYDPETSPEVEELLDKVRAIAAREAEQEKAQRLERKR